MNARQQAVSSAESLAHCLGDSEFNPTLAMAQLGLLVRVVSHCLPVPEQIRGDLDNLGEAIQCLRIRSDALISQPPEVEI
jgi:hypothetical protein